MIQINLFIAVKALGLGFTVYNILPNIYFRNKCRYIIKKIDNEDSIFLTFDDGPDPRYTLRILKILERYEIKATFFVVANKAKKHPDIINKMIEDGHGLGLHSYSHRSFWLSLFWKTKRDFEKSMEIFNDLNYSLEYFRPPWGTFNLFTSYFSRKNKLETILWSLNAQDWSKKTTVEHITNKIVDNTKSGDIIVLHDSNGAENAPENTIKALEIIIPKLIEKGFKFKTIDESKRGNKYEKIVSKDS
ncbi:polysaccharide deacetylase family protein [Tissierella sp. P1]|uniref:polysaccharide deacetylase family protein n=1 Tax=Tissierella sp. P1 TaxID=1280483 RepID=UPI001303EDFF|nr:polysaccharide deacetylase family protein [Tissierella sp. P1]